MSLVSSPCIGSPVLGSPALGTESGAGVLQLAITQQPSNAGTSGALLAQQPIVAAQYGGATATGFAGTVTMTVNQISGGPTTSNVPSQAAVAGVATFGGIRLTTAGVVTLTFSAPGVKPVTSIQITIT
jgi:hypothetical protein